MTSPPRPVGPEGRRMWEEWSGRVDPADLLTVCEVADERVALRLQVFRDGRAADRSALRELDSHLSRLLDGLRRSAAWREYATDGKGRSG